MEAINILLKLIDDGVGVYKDRAQANATKEVILQMVVQEISLRDQILRMEHKTALYQQLIAHKEASKIHLDNVKLPDPVIFTPAAQTPPQQAEPVEHAAPAEIVEEVQTKKKGAK